MAKKISNRPLKDILFAIAPSAALITIFLVLAYKYVDPAPPRRIVITTGDDEGEYRGFATLYKDIIKEDGVDLEIRPSSGAVENLKRLQDPKSDVDVGFVQDGLGSSDDAPDLSSLGSLYYEPIWVFYRGPQKLTRLSQLLGKRIGIGQHGGGTTALTSKLLKAAGVDQENSKFVQTGWEDAELALRKGQVDAAFFLATPNDPLIKKMFINPGFRLMSMDQSEAIIRQFPYLHHLVLPHGAIDLKSNLPEQDTDLISPTATLIVKDSLHPALIYLLLKAASQVHGEPGIFEKKDEFPIDKDYVFPLADEAKSFYKTGSPFWQRYLPFWLATLVERFILVMLPLIALLVPLVRLVPKIVDWRLKSRFYKSYGELKYLETQMRHPQNSNPSERDLGFLTQLDKIEERVNSMKVPLDFSDHVYVLREHIDFVRERLKRSVKNSEKV
jgi:TRAP transporter TAXI family solute receptor